MSDLKNNAINASAGKFTIKEVSFPRPKHNQAVIKVTSISLNRGEVRNAFNKKEDWVPGWDLAGEVVQAAEDGTGPKEQSRVVGFLPSGAWSQYVGVPTDSIAVLPGNVSDAQASTLPVAGLTALLTLAKGGQLLGKKVLITGATGGVGVFAVQLAALSGAHTTALVRSKEDFDLIKGLGADEIINSIDDAKESFDLILDSVGSEIIGKLINKTQKHGTIVSFGNSSEKPDATYNVGSMFRGSITLYGFIIFNELKTESPSAGLTRLVDLMNRNKLKTIIEKETDWKDIQQVAEDLMNRKFKGKAVLHIS
ncbi:MAG: zinc-binding dehydrogenase [Ginsengibacter sp.]